MLQIVNEPDRNAVSITVAGAPSGQEQDQLKALLNEQFAAGGPLHLLFDLDATPTEEADGLWPALLDGLTGRDGVGRVAVVGDEMWERTGDALETRFPNAEVQFFRTPHLTQAWSWVRGKV